MVVLLCHVATHSSETIQYNTQSNATYFLMIFVYEEEDHQEISCIRLCVLLNSFINIKMQLKEIQCEDADRIYLALYIYASDELLLTQ
jgi:hypothetical protein